MTKPITSSRTKQGRFTCGKDLQLVVTPLNEKMQDLLRISRDSV